MPKLPSFVLITAQPPEQPNNYILQTEPPYYLGMIYRLAPGDPQAAHKFANANKPLVYARVPGYNILILFAGNLDGYKVRASDANWHRDLTAIYEGMAYHYLTTKIATHAGQFTKFKI